MLQTLALIFSSNSDSWQLLTNRLQILRKVIQYLAGPGHVGKEECDQVVGATRAVGAVKGKKRARTCIVTGSIRSTGLPSWGSGMLWRSAVNPAVPSLWLIFPPNKCGTIP